MRRCRLALYCSFLLACSSVFIVSALAQSDRGTITGTISDPAGAVVANASIEARNIETGTVYPVVSTTTGNYTIAELPVGSYELTVSVPGFKKFVRSGFTVQVAQTVRIDVTLEVGATNDTVTVTAEATLLKTESGELSHTIEAKRLVDLGLLPIGGTLSSSQGLRFYMNEVALIPGTYSAVGFTTGARINGSPIGTQRTQIDGMDATNGLNSVQAGTQPSVDAMQETAIQTSNFSAEYGQVGGGLFNITLKSGTNQYHGAGYDYLANEAFNASTPFINTKPRIRRNDWGFNIGGPVRIPGLYNGKDKTFFFYNREQYREFFVVNDTAITVPTVAYRGGNFATAQTGRQLGTDPLGRAIIEGTIFDPLTARNIGGQIIRDPFEGNIIPASRMDKVSLAIQSLIPLPASGATSLNLVPAFPNDRVTTNESIKIDHQFTPNLKLSGSYLTNATATQYSQSLNGSEGLPPAITATRGSFTASFNWRANLDWAIRPTLLLHVGAGLVLYPFNDHSPTTDFDQVKNLGLTGTPVPVGRFPSIAGLCATGTGSNTTPCTGTGGMMSMGPGVGATQSFSKQVAPTWTASMTWVKENHTYKFGADVRTFGYLGHILTASNGLFNFSANQTAQPYNQSSTIGGGTIGFPYASFLLGLVNSGTVNPVSDVRTGKHFIAFFAQDTWKITRRLTLDYGLRYDYATYPKEQYGRMPTISPALPNPSADGYRGGIIYEATCHCSFANNYPYAFGPRLGVAYQITPKTVLRAGIGIAYDGTATANPGQTNAAPNNTFTAPGFGDAAMSLGGGVPSAYVLPWPNLTAGSFPNPNFPTNLNGPPAVVDQNAGRPARQIQWSIGVQRELNRNLVVEAAYVANRGAWWLSSTLDNYNALTPQILAANGLDINNAADRAILRATIGSTAAGRFQNKLPYAGFPTTSTVAQSLRPYPQFSGLSTGIGGNMIPLWAPEGRTWYDSLQVKATQRLWHGLDFTYAFTWAKELQAGTENTPGVVTVVNDAFNRANDKTISGLSRPLVSVIAAHYTLPSWGSNRVVSHVVRDWTLGAVLQYASGLPIPAPASNNRLSTLLFQNTVFNRVPGAPLFLKDLNCHCIDPTKDLVLNPAAWTDAPDGQWGTSAYYYNDYRYERRPNESISVGRVFRIKERYALTFRMNFTNIFNRIEMANPAFTNATAPTTRNTTTGFLTGGFGFINYVGGSTFTPPRQGTAELRFSF
jgi:hypothetical protein